MLDFYAKTRIRFSLRDKRLFEITEVEITRVDCIINLVILFTSFDMSHLNARLTSLHSHCLYYSATYLTLIRYEIVLVEHMLGWLNISVSLPC